MYDSPHRSDGFWYRLFTFVFIIITIGFLVVLYQNQRYLAQQVQYAFADSSRPLLAREPDWSQQSLHPWAVVQARAKDTVVQVSSQLVEIDFLEPYKTPSQGQSFGTGFFINEDGELVTNAHMVISAKSVWIQIPSLGKHIIDVDVLGICPERDLALLKVRAEDLAYIKKTLGFIPYLPLGDSDAVYRADDILALGYPLAQHSLKSTTGVVSGRERIGIQQYIQMSAPINPGSSGGPSLNRNGEVIGINSSGIPNAQNVGYIIPINEFKLILDDLRNVKLLRKPFLGVLHISGSDALSNYLGNPTSGGTYVVEIYNNSLLDKAGVKEGDMIYEINGIAIDTYGEMNVEWSEDKISIADYVSRLKLGENVKLLVYRKGTKKEFAFTFDSLGVPPIRVMYPDYEKIDYEVIGGMVIMPLSLNHVALLGNIATQLRVYTEPKEQQEPAIILVHILPNSIAHRARALSLGSIVTEVNGREVKTMSDFRYAVRKGKNSDFLTIKTSQGLFAVLPLKALINQERNFARDYCYALSPLVQELIRTSKSE